MPGFLLGAMGATKNINEKPIQTKADINKVEKQKEQMETFKLVKEEIIKKENDIL